MKHTRFAFISAAIFVLLAIGSPLSLSAPRAEQNSARDVLPEYHNREVTALVEDSESVRLAVGAAWDDALACRAFSGYLRAWTKDDSGQQSEAIVKRGASLYELVKCVDDGINSVRLARDTRDEPKLLDDVKFWRNELSLAARKVLPYAADAAALKGKLQGQLNALAASHKISSRFIPGQAWQNSEREAWRQAGPATGVRLPLETRPGSLAQWWDKNLSLTPGYLPAKLHSAGDGFFTPEIPVGAWGFNAPAPNQYDWTRLNGVARLLRDRQSRLLLELPTLQEFKTDQQVVQEWEQADKNATWILQMGYGPALPKYLAGNTTASLTARNDDGTLHPYGGVQLFDAPTAQAYGAYLKAMAANLKQQGFYETIGAIHLEMGDWAELPENVDYSDITKARWQKFMAAHYDDIAALNRAAATNYKSFEELPIPARTLDPRATQDWAEFTQVSKDTTAAAWYQFVTAKYKTKEGVLLALGDDYKDGYGYRLPFIYPPIIGIDYLHFRRQWVQDYLAIKRRLVAAAFPDKLIIAEMRQMGDHDGVQGLGEKKWGGFLADDHAQWTGVGPNNEQQPFMIRSVGPVGFGTRPSDSIESLFRDYLWLNFRDPGNLTRYFYHWVAHGYMDYQLGWHSVTNHWLTNQLIYDLGPTVANTAPQPQRIGLLLPRETYDLNNGPVYDRFAGWDWLLNAAKLPYTRIDEHFVRDGKLKDLGLEALILPEVSAMDGKLAAEIEQWVAGGGVLIASTIPGVTDEYGRVRPESPLSKVLGASPGGVVSEAIKDTPLTVTVPHGFYSGGWAPTTDRKPDFQVLAPTTAQVLASYESGKPAITVNQYGKGKAVTMGYPFGTEAVMCERTSIGFQRSYVWFAREPQLVARTAWLRQFFVDQLGIKADYGIDFAEIERFKGVEAVAPGFHMPKGLSQKPDDPFYIRTIGDPRPGHEIEVEHEVPDLALRFFPRHRQGVATRYLGISTRDVHYLGPRATINMVLARHTYRCRINNPKVQAIWDIGRNVPVGFERDAQGVAFTVSLPSGYIMMLAVSETPQVDLFQPAHFPGRTKQEVLARCKSLAGGKTPPPVVILTKADLKPWLQELATPIAPAPNSKEPGKKETIVISYGQEANLAAAQKLAAFLRDKFAIDVTVTEQAAKSPEKVDAPIGKEYETPVILIGNEWTNNDLAMHGAYWGGVYGAHLPFTATYAWPGNGRAVVSLSRRYGLMDENGRVPFMFTQNVRIRPVERKYPLLRRKLFIAANGKDADQAVGTLIDLLGKK